MLGAASGSVATVRAQSNEDWGDPLNLSNSGSSVSPSLLVNSKGTIHAFWLDEFNGYQYVNSTDGVTWSAPKAVQVPFPTDLQSPAKPLFLAGTGDVIHILWLDRQGALQYRRSSSTSLGSPLSWSSNKVLTDSAVRFDAMVDSKGTLHVGYIKNIEEPKAPAGIYYSSLSDTTWSAPKLIYPSKYYRSLSLKAGDDASANLQLATSEGRDAENVYIVWDDRSQKRIFLAKSPDGGNAWDGTFEVRGPDDFSGLEMPYNINLGASGDQVLLTWQAGTPGSQCTQYSQWSTDGARTFGQPVKVLDDFAQCPQSSQFLLSDKDISVVLFNTLGDLSLMAWDGTQWSNQLVQSQIASFTNPATLDNVILGCQNITASSEKIYLLGCDTGQGGDIWFTSRPMGSVETWFPPPSLWSRPAVLTDAGQKINSLLSIADHDGHIHNIWVQNAPPGEKGSMIQYARWDGKKWSTPATVISGPGMQPTQLTVGMDNTGKLLLAWVDASTGDLYFTWANSDNALSASEWQAPIYIPSPSGTNSAPDILTDASGKLIVTYAVPINEERGLYIVESSDYGTNWSTPRRVFDASTIDWQMVDRPKIALTGDGRLHILFERYTLSGDQRRSNGLYYIQSLDGGATWSQPETVSEQPILWSDLISHGKSDLNRIWEEQRETARVSIHQFSSDSGTTWSAPNTLSSLTDEEVANHVSTDLYGNLYFLQLTGPTQPGVRDQRWDGSAWKTLPPRTLDIKPDTWDPSSIVSSVSSNGSLVASLLGDSLAPKSAWQSEILSMTQSLEQKEPIPTPYPALIPAAPAQGAAPVVSGLFGTPTPSSALAGINDTQPFWLKNRNLIGLSLLGLVVAFLFLILVATSRTKDKGKTKTG